MRSQQFLTHTADRIRSPTQRITRTRPLEQLQHISHSSSCISTAVTAQLCCYLPNGHNTAINKIELLFKTMSSPEPGDTLVAAALKVLQVGKQSLLLPAQLQHLSQQPAPLRQPIESSMPPLTHCVPTYACRQCMESACLLSCKLMCNDISIS
jgi:hypothetical protein